MLGITCVTSEVRSRISSSLPHNTPQSAFSAFPDNTENFEIINHLHLIFKCYLFKSRDTRKISLERLKKNIINMFQRLNKRNKVYEKITYTRKPVKINKIYYKRCLAGG